MATAGHFAIQTPRSEAQTLNSINADDLTFGSQEASFVSPSKLNKAKQQHVTGPQQFLSRLTKPTGGTPLGEIKNNARPSRMGGKNEFTPLLKSVTKAEFMKRGLLNTKTPSKTRNGGLGKSASTSDLPGMAEMESGEFSGIGEESLPAQNENALADMSSASISFQKLPARSPGSSEGAAVLTLREQEKVIDDMRKENFSLKLKIFFMQDRLGKLAPEHYQAVFKENVEYKVEQATLRNELKKYKRSLLDAERNVARLAEEIKTAKNTTDPSFVCPLDHGMSEEEAAMLKQAQDEAEENKNEVMFAKKEIEDLKRELWECQREKKRLEDQGPGEDVGLLEAQVEELRGINEDLDLEVKALKDQVEQKEDELDLLQEQLVEEKRKVVELEARPVGSDDDELAQQMENSRQEIYTLNKKIADVEAQLAHARNEFQFEKDQLQEMAAEHKTTCEKVEQQLQELQGEYRNLEKELDEKQEEIDSYEARLQGNEGGNELLAEIRDLKEEIKQAEVVKQDLQDQIDSLQRDAAQLIEKDVKVARDRIEERKTLQAEIEELQIQLRETEEERERAVAQYEKESDRMETRLKEAEEQKVSLKKQIETFMNDEHTASGEAARIQRALRDETERHQAEVNSLQRHVDQLTNDVKEGQQLSHDLEIEINSLNEDLRTSKRVGDALNDELQELRKKVSTGGRDSELLRKIQAENTEFKSEIAALQDRLDTVSAQRDRLTRDMTGLRDQLNNTQRIEQEFGSVRAERDDLRMSTMAAQINVAKLKAQVNDLSRDPKQLEQKLSIVTRERDSLQTQVASLRSQLDDTKHQVDIQTNRIRTLERNILDAREDLEREQQKYVARSPRGNSEVQKLEDLLQQSRLRQAELGKINATHLDEINALERQVKRLEGELEAIQRRATANTAADRTLHSHLTLAKGQLADAREQLAQQEREFKQRLEENGSELERLKKGQMESVQTKLKLEEQVHLLTRQVARLESEVKLSSDVQGEKDLLARLLSVKKELDVVREDAEQKENKSQKHIRRLQLELENLRDQTERLSRDLHMTKKDANSQSQLLRRQLQESRDQLKQLKSKTFDHHTGSALTTQVEKRHTSELRGLGKQIRYLKAKLFREETFRVDLQYTKNFILMQINCFETCNKANLLLLEQMGIYPDARIREKRPKLRSVALSFIAIARMRRLKEDWAEHRKGGKELKESLRRLRGRKGGIIV